MKWKQLILAFIATICLIFAGNALAQTDININGVAELMYDMAIETQKHYSK